MSYCSRSNLDQTWGTENVRQWADLDNDGDQTKIDARVAHACDLATTILNDRLQDSPYRDAIPFDTPPTIITEIAAVLAGVWLNDARGLRDSPSTDEPIRDRLSPRRKWAEDILTRIQAGRYKLYGFDRVNSVPASVQFSTDIDDEDE